MSNREELEEKALQMAQEILRLDWRKKDGLLTYWEATNTDPRNSQRYHDMILKVCRKCVKDDIPILEYGLWEMPYCDTDGWIMEFANVEEFKKYQKQDRRSDISIQKISFWCPGRAKYAVLQKMGDNGLCDCDSYSEAIYVDQHL